LAGNYRNGEYFLLHQSNLQIFLILFFKVRYDEVDLAVGSLGTDPEM